MLAMHNMEKTYLCMLCPELLHHRPSLQLQAALTCLQTQVICLGLAVSHAEQTAL